MIHQLLRLRFVQDLADLGDGLGTETGADDLAGGVDSAVAECFEVDARGEGLPLEVKHAVDRLNLDPPAAPLHSLPDEVGVVAVSDNVLVAVFYIGVLKGNFALSFLLLPVRHL